MSAESTYDIIIAGGGTAGCVVAGRLAAADPSLSILVIESGPTTRDDPLHTQPARYMYHLRPDSTTIKFNVGKESAALGGRAPVVPCGQCLGGGSSVNFAMYTRAAASDYDDWKTVYGNKGWSSADLLPLLRKCETYQVQPGKPTHGYSGPLKVSYGGFYPELGQEFLNAATQYDKTRETTDDVNGLFDCNRYGRWQKWIDEKTGTRSDVPHHYIYPLQNAETKLRILTGHQVKRVIIRDGVAVGVQYIANPRFHPDSVPEVLTATARRMVVLSGGAIGSPAILERSGIGSKDILNKIGVKQIVDLPGVGENYQADHQLILAPYIAAESTHTLDGVVEDNEPKIEAWSKQWKNNGTGLLATNGLEAGIKIRPLRKDLEVIGPDFHKRWLDYYVPAPDKPVLWIAVMTLLTGDRPTPPGGKYFSVGWYLMHPTSIGYIHATSASDVNAPVDFHPGYLDLPEDMALHKWGYKRTREFARRMLSYRGEVPGRHPQFNPKSKAAAGPKGGPTSAVDADIEYTAEDDKAIEDYVKKAVATAWHSLGTCAMKKREEGGVVDERLNVYGVANLKVADLSICPGNVAANTYSTAVLIGEKAATLIAEELGIPMEGAAASAGIRPHL
ncbi:alcohol oxidase-like protein [Cubamyces menziesii]|nr:alcohol oxidase-like protein [Cubamyces menziesii]